jgi:preprotein translocase subunit SecA
MVIEKLGQIGEGRKKKQLGQTAGLVNTYEPELEDLSDPELAAKTTEFRERLESGETLEDLLPEAFA